MSKRIFFLSIIFFLLSASFLLKPTPAQAGDPQKIHREDVYLQINDADFNRGGISLKVTLIGKDVNEKDFSWAKTYNNPSECESAPFVKQDPCIKGGDFPDGPDDNGNPAPQLNASGIYNVTYEVHHYVNGRTDTGGKVTCRNNNCGPFGSLRINSTIRQTDYTFTAPPPLQPTLETSSPELLPKQQVTITINQLDERLKYAVNLYRQENSINKSIHESAFSINDQLNGCSMGVWIGAVYIGDGLKLNCTPLESNTRYNAVKVTFNVEHSDLLKNDTGDNLPPDRTYGIKITSLPKYTDSIKQAYIVSNNLNLLFRSTSTPPKQKLDVKLNPSTISMDDLKTVGISVSGVTTGKKYNVALGSNIPSYNNLVAQGPTLELTFDPKTQCMGAPCFRATDTSISPITVIASDSENPSIYGSATLTVIPSTGSVTPRVCSDQDIQNGRCTSAGGKPTPGCNDPNDPNDPKKSNPHPGIATAIGCIHTNPLELTKDVMTFIMGIAGGLAFLLMLGGAFQILTSAGNPETLNAGKERLTNAIIGLLLIIFAVLILQIVGVDILHLPGFGR